MKNILEIATKLDLNNIEQDQLLHLLNDLTKQRALQDHDMETDTDFANMQQKIAEALDGTIDTTDISDSTTTKLKEIMISTLSNTHERVYLDTLIISELVQELQEENESNTYHIQAFHGSSISFDAFDDNFKGDFCGSTPTNLLGHFFTADITNALTYGPNLYKVTLSISNPYTLDAKGENYSTFKDVINELAESIDTDVYDALIITNYRDSAGKKVNEETQYCIFNPDNISIVSTHYIK